MPLLRSVVQVELLQVFASVSPTQKHPPTKEILTVNGSFGPQNLAKNPQRGSEKIQRSEEYLR
jgi:hypothetical protein